MRVLRDEEEREREREREREKWGVKNITLQTARRCGVKGKGANHDEDR